MSKFHDLTELFFELNETNARNYLPKKSTIISVWDVQDYVTAIIWMNTIDGAHVEIQSTLEKQLENLEKLRQHTLDKQFEEILIKSKEWDTPKEENHIKKARNPYLDIHPIALVRLLRSFVGKDKLKDKTNDLSRFSAIEIIELERLYEFLKTEDGKQILHEGIVDMMKIESPELSPEVIKKVQRLHLNPFREEVLSVTDAVQKVNKHTNQVLESWKTVDEYIWYIRGMLIRYYTRETELAWNNHKNTSAIQDKMGTTASDKQREVLKESIVRFKYSFSNWYDKLKLLVSEQRNAEPIKFKFFQKK